MKPARRFSTVSARNHHLSLRGSTPYTGKSFSSSKDLGQLWVHLASYWMGKGGFFHGAKQQKRDADKSISS